ncbi:MAG: helix-turn-helix transcriptional regulator [Lachnospiraceae bacterium]|nr:helix-turn-helix transcriptional regulator [Lachnospiraceae bacterium]
MDTFQLFKLPGDVSNEIAMRVRARRKEQNLTQKSLSRKSNVSLGSVKRFEQTGEISLSSLIKIAFALGYETDFDDLFAKKSYSSIQEVIDGQL